MDADEKRRDDRPLPPGRGALGLAAIVALAAAAGAIAQAVSVALTGEELCVGGGCAVVGALTRIPPALFNLVGATVFALAGALALAARRTGSPALGTALRVLLAGSLAAEGVLFAYQWHVAGAWCTYCLVILSAVALLNLLCGARSALYGFASFGATAVIFSLLTFVPVAKDLDDGSVAVQTCAGSPELYLIFSENCPHCRNVLDALKGCTRCTVRFNPISELPPGFLPGLPEQPYDPRVNVAAAKLLGLETVPVLVAREPAGLRIVYGEGAILSYVQQTCSEPPADEGEQQPDALAPWSGDSLLAPPDEGCGLTPDCD